MGELRAYLLPVRVLRRLLTGRPTEREHVLALVVDSLGPSRRPEPFGPIYTRVPGVAPVPADTPTRDDLERLLGAQTVPPERARATWRLVEAVAAGVARSTTRTANDRPTGLAPLGLAVPAPDGLVVGSWTVSGAAVLPSLSDWLEVALDPRPDGPDDPDVVVFWEAGPTG